MVELTFKPDPFRPNIYIMDNVQHLGPDSVHVHLTLRSPIWRPPTDVFETDEAVIVRSEIAGMAEVEFSIVLDDRYLVVRGLRPDITERRSYYQMEIMFGDFIVEVELPCPVDSENAQAIYQNGFLRIELPKARPKQIPIE
jgi:HSP20 family protein